MKNLLIGLILLASMSSFGKCRMDVIDNLESQKVIFKYDLEVIDDSIYFESVTKLDELSINAIKSKLERKISFQVDDPVFALNIMDNDSFNLRIPIITSSNTLEVQSLKLENKRNLDPYFGFDTTINGKKVIFGISKKCFLKTM